MSHMYLFLIPVIRFSHRDTQQISQIVTKRIRADPYVRLPLESITVTRVAFLLTGDTCTGKKRIRGYHLIIRTKNKRNNNFPPYSKEKDQ